LNTQSRGLLLDPMNGLADLEKQEIRSLSIHGFTNQPIRLMRILRYCARMGFKMEPRTQEWFDLAMQRDMQKNIEPEDVGHELRSLAREDNPVATLKEWEKHALLGRIHPSLQKRKPDYDSLNKLAKSRTTLASAGLRPRLQYPVLFYTLGRLKSREAASAMRSMEFRSSEMEAIANLVPEAQKVVKVLKGRKTNTPKDAYFYIASLAPEMIAFIETEMPNPRAVSKFRSYIQKWRPLRQSLPMGELDALGVPRGPKFDKVIEQFFEMQLRGKGKLPEERTKILRNLAGIKDEPKKVEKPEKKRKGEKGERKAAADIKEHDKAKPGTPSSVAGTAAVAAKTRQDAGKQSQSASAAIGARARAKHAEAESESKVSVGKKRAASGGKAKMRSPKKSSRR
jgi:tRNA nucleotidyltransferase/poly(A) polymerase